MSGLNSLEKVLTILNLFTEDRLNWTADDLIQTTGYPRPTLYRYLKVLREAGLLSALSGAGYTLGPRVVEMDYLLRKSDPLILAGQKHLERLTGLYPCSALLMRWYGERILCVAVECSTPNPLSSYHRGRPMALTRGAIARSIVAALPMRQQLPFIAEHRADLQAVGLGLTDAEIIESFRQVRRQGYAVAYGEVTPGVVGIAAPVFDSGEIPIACVCLTIAGNLITGNLIKEIGVHIRDAGADISRQLSTSADAPAVSTETV